jgi:SAM-dependent methyltransferase
MTDPTQRFSSRVENYVKYRPTYPPEIIATLREECQLTPAALIADIGSGTGLLTELFLQNGNRVFAVEPNDGMRKAGEQLLRHHANFQSIVATAEATTLADRSIDFIIAGQAFHWFDRHRARREFVRILKPAGWVMLVWNERETGSTPFLQAYEHLLEQYATDYTQVDHRQIDETILADFYEKNGFKLKTFRNIQRFDYAGLEGRLLSSSYTPEPGHPNYAPMLAELAKIFQAHAVQGQVEFEYTTKMYYGMLSGEKE